MRVAMLLPSLANQGPVIVARDIVHNLAQRLDAVHVYHFDPVRELDFQVPTFRIGMRDQIPFDDYDIIHSHMLRPDYYVWKNRGRIRVPCVTTLHNYVEADLRYRYNRATSLLFTRIWKVLVSRHDRIVALSRDMEGYYRSLYGARSISYIYNGRDEGRLTVSLRAEQERALDALGRGRTVIGAVALLTKRKGIDQLIRLLAAEEKYALAVVGSGQEEGALKALAARLGVTERCLFLGYQPNAAEFFRYFDIYAIPSVSEGFPLALIEAASFGKAVVCSDIPVFREIFTEEEVSFFTLYDLPSLKDAVERAAAGRESLSRNIYRKYRESYTAQTMAANYHRLYLELAGLSEERGGDAAQALAQGGVNPAPGGGAAEGGCLVRM